MLKLVAYGDGSCRSPRRVAVFALEVEYLLGRSFREVFRIEPSPNGRRIPGDSFRRSSLRSLRAAAATRRSGKRSSGWSSRVHPQFAQAFRAKGRHNGLCTYQLPRRQRASVTRKTAALFSGARAVGCQGAFYLESGSAARGGRCDRPDGVSRGLFRARHARWCKCGSRSQRPNQLCTQIPKAAKCYACPRVAD